MGEERALEPVGTRGVRSPAVELLSVRREEVLRAWERRVREDPRASEARRLSGPALRDDMPALLDDLARNVAAPRGAQATQAALRVGGAAAAHASARFRQGYTLVEVLSELGHLRTAIFEVARDRGIEWPHESSVELHAALDGALVVAANEFERLARADATPRDSYQSLVDSVREYAIVMLDPEGRIATWNEGAARLMGYDASDVVGRSLAMLFAPEEQASGAPLAILRTARSLGSYRGRHRRVRKDGRTFWGEVTVTPVHDASGALRGYSKVTRDASSQIDAERAARESEARLRAIVSSAMDAIITMDASTRVLLWNRSAEQTFGLPAQQALGQRIDRFVPERFRAELATHIEQLAQSGETAHALGRHLHVRALRANGEEFPVEATISQATVGDEKLYTIVLRDVSERVADEEARVAAEARLQAIIDNTGALIYAKDLEGRYILVNDGFEKVVGIPRGEVLGATDDQLFSREHAARLQENDRAAAASPVPLELEETTSVRGEVRTFISVKFALRDRAGRATAIAGISTDVTGQARERDALARSLEVRDLFVGVLAHDLRNPLNAIAMTAIALLAREELDDSLAKGLTRISNGARRMSLMVDQLLDFTRARLGGGLTVECEPGDLGAICAQVVEESEAAHPDRTITLEHEGDLRGRWDATRMAQAVGNLVGNALAYSPRSSPVHVRARGTAREVRIEVQNENAGAPISAEERAHIFDPFSRGAHERRGREGLGLGLFIVDQIVRAHGGTTTVESDAEGGTRFEVVLPRRST